MKSNILRRRTALLVIVLLSIAGLAFVFGSDASKTSQRDNELAAADRKIAPEVVKDTADGARASVVVFLADQADVSAAYDMKDQNARGWYVYKTLSEHAARTQAPLKAMLDGQGLQYQSFWAANMLVVDADRSLVDQLAARDDVARVDPNRPARGIEDPAIADIKDEPAFDPETIETGVNNVQAPPVWAQGFTGQGIVIGNQDTGMRWTHNAIKGHYRGWNGSSADHNYNWHDAIHSGGGVCGANSQQPCDDDTGSTHGTHTTGTTNGDDGAGNQIGVAPGAKWIGCRNMNQGDGTPATYTECFQFFIAPTDLAGNNPNPTLRPHVMNNSWGCPTSEGCVTRAELETIVNNTQAAGIFVVVSAGNSGSGCASVSDPAAIYDASFSVGAISGSTNTIASFSSRGPSTFYSPNLLKPNISAPGVGVRSSQAFSDSSYGSLSGTSMAGPHVVGVVALLWSARPQLARDIAATKSILQNSANPNVVVNPVQTCGGTPSTQIPNNTFGWGRVDALAAVNSVSAGTPTPSPAATPTPSPAATPTPTVTPSPTPSPTRTPTPTPTITPTPTPPPPTPTPSPSASVNPTSTPTPTPTPTPTITPTPPTSPTPTPFPHLHSRADFDGDDKTDLSIFRPSEGNWYIQRSTAGFSAQHFGLATDKLVPGDFDGDGITDIAVFRPSEGNWYILNSGNSTIRGMHWGTQDDVPFTGDFGFPNGLDGRSDLVVYRPSTQTWYVTSGSGEYANPSFGAVGDVPLVMDPDGDGRMNIAVFRPSNNTWYIGNSLTDPSHNFRAIQWGQSGDSLVPADYDGDNWDDVAVFRPSNGVWYIRKSSDGILIAVQFGTNGDVPVPGDYDGDGRDDQAVYRAGTWYLNRSTSGFAAAGFGLASDTPVPRAYIP